MTNGSRRLYVSMITSLDGYIEGPDRELDWFADGEQFERYADEMVDSVGVALYGRVAYELMLAYWPRQTDAFGAKMNALPKVVLSRTLERAEWANTRVVRDVDAIAALKREPGKPIVAWAGAQLVASLLAARLVDELRVIVQPVALGGGTPLFRAPLAVRHVRTQILAGGLNVLCYEPIYR